MNKHIRVRWFGFVFGLALAATLLGAGWAQDALACGGFFPPTPVDGTDVVVVNQHSEQIIFEVGATTVAAHVMIQYEGNPKQFAWLLPVPGVPEVSLSEALAFSLLDDLYGPGEYKEVYNWCPWSRYYCEDPCEWVDDGEGWGEGSEGGGIEGSEGPATPGIVIEKREQIGSYDVVVLSGAEAGAVVKWLQDNGFVINAVTEPYIQMYLDAKMNFLAIKLVPGADVKEIRPLRVTFEGSAPMIPLRIAAVAAEPHVTIVSYIFGDSTYVPVDLPLAAVNPDDVASYNGRGNYPFVLARTIDEAGGGAFVIEYAGGARVPDFDSGDSGCCETGGEDNCGLGGNGECECPNDEFDQADCAQIDGLLPGLELVKGLAARHSMVTRLVTRLSPEEMTFDVMFRAEEVEPIAPLIYDATEHTLEGCRDQVVDKTELDRIVSEAPCTTVYCGRGVCGTTPEGAGCACEPGFVARRYVEYDGFEAVTCVPEAPAADWTLGLNLPDACQGADCGLGACVALAGVAACKCPEGTAAVAVAGSKVASCAALTATTGTPGAQHYAAGIQYLEVCEPPPPECGPDGWLKSVGAHASLCGAAPAPEDFKEKDFSCDGMDSSAGAETGDAGVPELPTLGKGPSTPVAGDDSADEDADGGLLLEISEDADAGDTSGDSGCACAANGPAPMSGAGAMWLLFIAAVWAVRRRRG